MKKNQNYQQFSTNVQKHYPCILDIDEKFFHTLHGVGKVVKIDLGSLNFHYLCKFESGKRGDGSLIWLAKEKNARSQSDSYDYDAYLEGEAI